MDLKERVGRLGGRISQKWETAGKGEGEKRQVKENSLHWKTSRSLRIVLTGVLCLSVLLGSFTGVEMIRLAEGIDAYEAQGISPTASFAGSAKFSGLLGKYMDIWELYMELAEIVDRTENQEGTTETAEDGLPLEELCTRQGGNGFDYESYARNYINHMLKEDDGGTADLLELTREIRSLGTMVAVEGDDVFFGPEASGTLSRWKKQKIKKQAKKLKDRDIYRGMETVLPAIAGGSKERETGKVNLCSIKRTVKSQNLYQSWLFRNYPEYTDAYLKTVFARAYEAHFKKLEDGLDYSAYKNDFMRDYRKTCYWQSSKNFYVIEVEDSTLKPDKTVLCCRDRNTGEEIHYPDNQIFYLDNGETITAAQIKGERQEGIISYGFFDTSRKEYANMLQMMGEQEAKRVSARPWDVQVVPCSMEMAQDYARFLAAFYKVLGDALENSPFLHYYGSEEKRFRIKGSWKKIIDRLESGKIADGQGTTDSGDVLYACYNSNGLLFQTNFPDDITGRIDLQKLLKRVGDSCGTGRNYVCAVGVNLNRVRQPHYSDADAMSQVFQEFEQGQEAYVRLKNRFVRLMPAMVLAALGMVFSLLMLMVMCGHRKDRDTICLWWSDRIWLEAMLLLGMTAAVFFCYLMMDGTFQGIGDGWFEMMVEQVGVPCVMAVLLLILSFVVLSLVRRWKGGMLLRSSLLCQSVSRGKKLVQKGWKIIYCIGAAFREAPVLWRYGVLAGVHVLAGIPAVVILLYGLEAEEILLLAMLIFLLLAADVIFMVRCVRNALADQRICEGASRIAQGQLSYKIQEMKGISREQAGLINVINHIGDGLEQAVEESVRSERMKAELITNVSHDIKTPLTSVINYIDLLKREQIDSERAREYLDVLEIKSQRLKSLIEDLVEASKASSGALELQITQLNFTELLRQTKGEFEEKFQRAGLTLVDDIPQETVSFRGDGRRVYRVLENLYGNAAKYAMSGTRVYVRLWREQGKVVFSIKNVSREQLDVTAEELTERFVRGERSRSTEGSGLGLSIAKSLTELMEGEFHIYLDGDLFGVTVSFPMDQQ